MELHGAASQPESAVCTSTGFLPHNSGSPVGTSSEPTAVAAATVGLPSAPTVAKVGVTGVGCLTAHANAAALAATSEFSFLLRRQESKLD